MTYCCLPLRHERPRRRATTSERARTRAIPSADGNTLAPCARDPETAPCSGMPGESSVLACRASSQQRGGSSGLRRGGPGRGKVYLASRPARHTSPDGCGRDKPVPRGSPSPAGPFELEAPAPTLGISKGSDPNRSECCSDRRADECRRAIGACCDHGTLSGSPNAQAALRARAPIQARGQRRAGVTGAKRRHREPCERASTAEKDERASRP